MELTILPVLVCSVLFSYWQSGLVSCLNLTIVHFGFANVPGRFSGARHTAVGVQVAINEFSWYRNTEYADLNLNCSQVILEIPNSTDCKDAEANFHMVAQYYYSRQWDEDNIMAMITPGCGDSLIVGSLAREWDVFMGATAFSYPDTRDRDDYPTYVTFSNAQVSIVVDTMLAFFGRYNWTNVGVIYDTSGLPSYYELIATMKAQVAFWNSSVQFDYVATQLTNKPFSAKQILLTAKTFTRIIVLSMHPLNVRKFMLAAHELQMDNGEYITKRSTVFKVYISPTAVPGSSVSGNLTWQMNDEDDENAFQAYRQLFNIRPCPRQSIPQLSMTLQSLMTVNADYNLVFSPGDDNPTETNIAAYQGFYVYLQALLHSDKRDLGGASVANRMLGRMFETSFGKLYVDESGQRLPRHCILDLNVTTQKFETVMYYTPYYQRLDDEPNATLDFGGGEPPRNEPRCGYLGTKCRPVGSANILAPTMPPVLIALVVLSILIVWLFYRRFRREHLLSNEIWMLDPAYLEPVTNTNVSMGSFKSSKKLNVSVHRHYEKPDYLYKGEPVGVKIFLKKHGRPVLEERSDKKLLMQIIQISHPNTVPFFGVCLQNERVYFLEKFCSRGNLFNFLADISQNPDWELRCSLINDLVEGLCYIHDTPLKRHGYLSASTCLIDTRFTLLISELGFADLIGPTQNLIAVDKLGSLLNESDRWAVSSVNLKSSGGRPIVDSSGDILSLGRIMTETLITADANVPPSAQQTSLERLFKICCSSDPKQRPSAKSIRERFRRICKLNGDGLLANILSRMESYASQLEKQVQERTLALAKERAMCDDLLSEMLPRWILDQLYSGCKITPEVFPSATIFFSHIWGFLYFVATHNPLQIFSVINGLFIKFDRVITNFDVYKVETVEDQYMVFSGKSDGSGTKHAVEICRMALSFRVEFAQMRNDALLQFMAGVHTGPCAAGVIGHKCPRYCLFGDSVNVASRISTSSKPSRIHVSISTADMVGNRSEFVLRQRGLTSLKGRGEMQTYWLNSSD